MNELIDEMMIDSFEWIKQNETKKIMSKMWKQWIELNECPNNNNNFGSNGLDFFFFDFWMQTTTTYL